MSEIVCITPFAANGKVVAPPSKSAAHRALICAFLAGKGVVQGVGECEDVLRTLEALRTLGGVVERVGDNVRFLGRKKVNEVVVDCGESGSTLRFLLPLCAALGIKARFTGAPRLIKGRPSDSLLNTLNERGANISDFCVQGSIKAGEYTVDGSVSSQYVSGLLFALSTFSQNSFLRVTGERVSAKYVDMTIKTLADYGVEIKSEENGFFVRGGQTFKEREYVVEGDWSGAAFPLTLGAIGGAVSLENLNVNTLQGDAYILKALALFGAETLVNEGSVCVKSQTLQACEIDCKDIPDLVQILSVAAAYAKGESVFTNVSRLRYKESDRLQGILDMLCSAGIAARVEGDALIICGGEPQGAAFMPQADHRSVMSCAVLAACAKGESTIANAQAVGKSYPKFYQDLKVLGGGENVRIHR